jgi:hypothetical protein
VNEVASYDKGKNERECTRDMLVKVVLPMMMSPTLTCRLDRIGRSKTPKVEGANWPNIDATLLRRTTIKVAFGFASHAMLNSFAPLNPTCYSWLTSRSSNMTYSTHHGFPFFTKVTCQVLGTLMTCAMAQEMPRRTLMDHSLSKFWQ